MLSLLVLLPPAHADQAGEPVPAPDICTPLQLEFILGSTLADGATGVPTDTDPLLVAPNGACDLEMVALVDLTTFDTFMGTAEYLLGQRAVHWPGQTLQPDHEYALDDGLSQIRFQTGSTSATAPSEAPSFTVHSRSITPYANGDQQITLQIEASEAVLISSGGEAIGYVLPEMGVIDLTFFDNDIDSTQPLCVAAQARNEAGVFGLDSDPDCAEPLITDTLGERPRGCSFVGGWSVVGLFPFGLLAARRRAHIA